MKLRIIKRRLTIVLIVFIVLVLLFFNFEKINSINDITKINKITILDKNEEVIYEENNSHQSTDVMFEDINERLKELVVKVEDKNFYKHHGFDIYRITRVFFYNLFHQNKHGASTITQQYVKNLYLSNHKTYIRKINELVLATRLENIYSKEDILQGYLNTIYFSSNIYGISDASTYFFNKDQKDLDVNEIALLLVLIKSPNNYSPVVDYEKSMEKKDEMLRILHKNKLISNKEFTKYHNKDIKIYQNKVHLYSSSVMYFKDIVKEELKKLNLRLDFNQNIVIYTNFEQNVNNEIDKNLNNFTVGDVCSVIIDKDGYYVSVVGGNDYYKNSFNIATMGKRDIGSTIKPLLYYEALKVNLDPLSKFKSEETTFYVKGEKFKVKNFNNVYENSNITMLSALATSDNIFAVKTHLYLGMDKLRYSLKKFNVESDKSYMLALGNVDMSLSKLSEIYYTFSTLGLNKTPKAIKKVEVSNKTVYVRSSKSVRLLDESYTYVLNNMMTFMFDDNISNKVRVTGYSINNNILVNTCGKSGLTNYDSYMIGFNNNYTVGVWSGYINNDLLINDELKKMPKALYSKIFNSLDNNEDVYYDIPQNVVLKYINPTTFNISYKKEVAFINN